MKKTLLFLFALLSFGFVKAQTCSELFISEYVEGWLNNKAIEIYNPTGSSVDLSNYRLVRYSNGSTTSNFNPHYCFNLSGTLASHDVIVIMQDTNHSWQDTMLYADLISKADLFAPGDYNSGVDGSKCVFWNGDDAIALQKDLGGDNWTDVDIFGVIGERPLNVFGTTSPVGGWTTIAPYNDGQGQYLTKDKTLVRKPTVEEGVSSNPSQFNALLEWDSLSVNTFDSLGGHSCNCGSTAIEENVSSYFASVYPNPSTNGMFYVQSDKNILKVELMNILGQRQFAIVPENNTQKVQLRTENLEYGLYLIRIELDGGNTISKKIRIK